MGSHSKSVAGGGPPVVAAEAGDLTRDAFAQAEWEEHCLGKSLASLCGRWERPPAGPLLAAPVLLRHTPLGWEPPRGLGWAWGLGLQGHKSVGLTPFVPRTLRGSGETPAAKIRLFCLVQPPSNRVQSRSKPDISLVVAINFAMPWRKRLTALLQFLNCQRRQLIYVARQKEQLMSGEERILSWVICRKLFVLKAG